jgi:hypothetical protein
MKKNVLFLCAIVFAFSCSKEEIEDIELQNDRLSFKNLNEFNETYQMLSEYTSKEELQYWAQTKGHSTLLCSNDTAIEKYSNILRTILNKDSEYEIGDLIIWFNNGNLYSFSKKEQSNISNMKKNPNACNLFGYIKLSNVDNSELKTVSLGLNGLDARNQKEFNQKYYKPCGETASLLQGIRKFVHEIYDESFFYNPGPVIYSYLHLRIKLEYRDSKGRWCAAGEQRDIHVNVSGTAKMYPSGIGGAYIISNRKYSCSGNKDFVIMAVRGSYLWRPSWKVSMSGTIYQKVNGDLTSNGWNNSGELW